MKVRTGAAAAAAADEARRVEVLHSYDILDTPPDFVYDDLAQLASHLCSTPMAAVTLVDVDRTWTKAAAGMAAASMQRGESFCTHVLERPDVLLVPDARLDPRFAANAFVVGGPRVVFYAGAPLVTPDGVSLGRLCVMDILPRTLTPAQLTSLQILARQVMAQIVLHRRTRDLAAQITAGQTAADELRRSRSLLEGVLLNSDSVIYAKDLEGRFLLANPALHEVLGKPAGSARGRTNHDLFPADVADEITRNDEEVATSGCRRVFAETLVHADGKSHDYISAKFPLTDTSGRIFAVAGVSTDVTELAARRRALSAAEQRWRALVEDSPVPVAVIATSGQFLYANAQAALLYGVDDLVNEPVTRFVPPEAFESQRAAFRAALDGERANGHRSTLWRPDGRRVEVVVNAGRVDFDGEPAVQIQLRDVTETVAAEAVLRESESRWRAVFEGSPVAIGLSDEHGNYVAVNAALCVLTGCTEAELLGRNARHFTHPDDLAEQARVGSLITEAPDGVARLEQRLVRPSGEIRWIWLTFTHTAGPAGQIWTLAHIQDITDRKADEQAVAASEANLRAVAEVVAEIQAGADPCETIVRAAGALSGARYVSLAELTADGAALRVSATSLPELLGLEMPLAMTSVTGQVLGDGEALFLPKPADHPLISAAFLAQTNARSLYVVPVRSGLKVTGVLAVGWAQEVTDLDDQRATVVRLLADQAGVALRQATLVAELEALAHTDPLTGLPNRRSWDERIAALVSLARRYKSPLTVGLADLDRFKAFNDTYGHAAGDALLRTFADGGNATLREVDTLARWGGEEFAVALPDCSLLEAPAALERIRAAVPAGQTCTIGYARWDGRETAADLMARADAALYAAKNAGRNRIALAPENRPSPRGRRVSDARSRRGPQPAGADRPAPPAPRTA